MKRERWLSFILIITIFLVGCSNVSKADMQKLIDENNMLKNQNSKLQEDLSAANKRIEDFSKLEAKYKKLEDYEMAAQLAAYELQAEKDRQQKEKLLADEKAKAEAEAAKKAAAAEAEAKKGYETGITYNQLARTPDDYNGKKVKFSGEVIQLIDGGSDISLRVAVNSDYNKVLLVYYPSSLTKTRVLENDMVSLYGISEGLYTYQSTMSGNITIPIIKVDKIEIK